MEALPPPQPEEHEITIQCRHMLPTQCDIVDVSQTCLHSADMNKKPKQRLNFWITHSSARCEESSPTCHWHVVVVCCHHHIWHPISGRVVGKMCNCQRISPLCRPHQKQASFFFAENPKHMPRYARSQIELSLTLG